MRVRFLLLAAFLLIPICGHGTDCLGHAANEHKDASPDMKAIANGNNQFAFDLYHRLQTKKGNLFFSPNSISTALAMTYGGAKADTAKQMAAVLHFDLPQNQLQQAFSELRQQLSANDKDTELRTANRLWGQSGYKFLPAYLQLTKNQYGAELGQVDFKNKTEAARQEINAWVSDETKGKIEDLLQPGILSPQTRLVLTNAIYFKGKWGSPFGKKSTKNLPFTVSADTKPDVPTMTQTRVFGYGTNDDLQMLDLSYGGNKLSMLVLLPNEVDGLESLEGELSEPNLEKWTSSLSRKSVEVYLPKFKLTSELSLGDTLKSMGMIAAFEPGADFSGMDGKKDLSLSAVVHKAYVDVNEEGTEAAAATGVIGKVMAEAHPKKPEPPPVFRADHPFVFLIRDTETGSILFMGRVARPAKASSKTASK